jgi:dipeptidyl aminopeptidase/acylaminoacyl peptidase
VTDIFGFSGDNAIVTRNDMNRAPEIYTYDLKKNTFKQITNINSDTYNSLALSKTERRYVTTTDGKKMLVWVILPPNFDPSKKYPTLLYCQGGPQSPLTQMYSFRWNFQLMAAQGYIVVAPNRRGMAGHGVKWNEDISKDWGGQVMRDYLSAIDEVSKESYVDKSRLGCVGQVLAAILFITSPASTTIASRPLSRMMAYLTYKVCMEPPRKYSSTTGITAGLTGIKAMWRRKKPTMNSTRSTM